MKNNILENLELKLQHTRLENSEKLDKIEAEYNKKYSVFLDNLFDNNSLGFKRFVCVSFSLKKLDNPDLNNDEIFKSTLKNALDLLLISKGKKILFETISLNLLSKTESISEIFIKNTSLFKDHNFPILNGLEDLDILSKEDILKISLEYKQKNNFLDSISILYDDKVDIIKKYYYELNNTKKESRMENFKNDFSEDIQNSQLINSYPKVLNFVGKNYFRFRVKNRLENKKNILRRVFKITFLKLYRLKHSGIDISSIINKIDSLDDLESMINLILKFFEVLKNNPSLTKDYLVSEEIDDISEIYTEAEENKDKTLFFEKSTVKVNNLIERGEKHILSGNLESILDENIDLVGDNFIKREDNLLDENIGFFYGSNENSESEEDDEDNSDLSKEIDLDEYYNELKVQFEDLEKRKNKLFLDGDYDFLDSINDEIVELLFKIQKVSKLLGLED